MRTFARLAIGLLALTLAGMGQAQARHPSTTPGLVYGGYTVTDLYTSWQPQQLGGLRLDLSVNNLTDEYYSRAWDQLPQPGREVIASIRYSF